MEDTNTSQDSDWQYLQKHENHDSLLADLNPFRNTKPSISSRRKSSGDTLVLIDGSNNLTPTSASKSVISFENKAEPENSKSITNPSIVCHYPQNADVAVRTSYITLSDTQHNNSVTSRPQSTVNTGVHSNLDISRRSSGYAISLNELDEK